MTIQQILVFYSLSRTLNYSHSAQELFMTRQAVRQNITTMERELGGALFTQEHNHLFLSSKGKLLARECGPLIDAWNHLQMTMINDIQPSGVLKICISVSAVPDFLSGLDRALLHFQEDFPKIRLKAEHVENDTAVARVLDGTADLSIILDLGTRRAGIAGTDILSFPLCLLLASGHPLAKKRKPSWADLEGCRIALPGTGEEWEPLRTAFRREGIRPVCEVVPNYYQLYYAVRERDYIGISRYVPEENDAPDRVRMVPVRQFRITAAVITAEKKPCVAYEPLRQYLFSYYRTYFAAYLKSLQ